MSDALSARVGRLRDDFFSAISQGPDAVASFNDAYLSLRNDLEQAAMTGALSAAVRDAARAAVACIEEQALLLRDLDTLLVDVVQAEGADEGPLPTDAACQQPSLAACVPLFDYLLLNICHPYPDIEEKDRLASAVRDAGWHDFDKKKVEDWLLRKRHQSGFGAIMRKYCDEDRDAMRHLCQVALFGSAGEKARLPDGAVEDVEDMHEFVQSQLDDLSASKVTSWVDDLTDSVEAVLAHERRDFYSSDEFATDDSYSDSSSDDSESDGSVTDVDDEDDEPPPSIIGAKRKFCDRSVFSPPPGSRPLSRSLSMTSSVSSSSTACSLRSFSGSSVSMTSVESDDDNDRCDRPAKRPRGEFADSQADSNHSMRSSDTGSSPASSLDSTLFTAYRAKRGRSEQCLGARLRSMKRSRYTALGVAPETLSVSASDLSTLSSLCSLDWAPGEVAVVALDAEGYTVDCTQPDSEGEVELEELTVCPHEDDEAVLTWTKLQIFAILRMLLSTSISAGLLPPSLVQSATYAFDVDGLDAQIVTALDEMLRLMPEQLSVMFNSMNALAPAPAQPIAGPTPEDVAVAPVAPALTQDITAPSILDVTTVAYTAPVPALDALPIPRDDFAPAAGTPNLSIDPPAPDLRAPAFASDEESLSATTSDSEGDSPPALSDGSGSSSRSSSPESDGEQDSLLMSPAALSADYSRLNDELSAGKAPDADPSQFQLEFGAVAEVSTVDESSCASELLLRYLNDPTTWT